MRYIRPNATLVPNEIFHDETKIEMANDESFSSFSLLFDKKEQRLERLLLHDVVYLPYGTTCLLWSS